MKVRRGFVNHSFQQGRRGPAGPREVSAAGRRRAADRVAPRGMRRAPAAGRRVLPRPRPWLARRLGEATRPRCAAAAAGMRRQSGASDTMVRMRGAGQAGAGAAVEG